MLNLNQLRVLAAVARHGSVTGAARELHYSQPSVSHHLARLEEATGATLLQRVGRGIRLTPEGVRLVHLLDDPLYLISRKRRDTIAAHRDSAWVGGCERCTAELVALCEKLGGFTPRIAHHSDDSVVMQTFVAAGMGVTLLPGLALEAHRVPGIESTELREHPRRIYAATYGDPPDPPATARSRPACAARGCP